LPNAQGTIGSLTSLLTGRHPADVRVIYSSDMLQATDAYQHLPGILNSLGYYTVQLSNAQYADAYKTNFQSAFDEANGRSATDQPVNNALNRLYPGITAIFQNEVIERISARILHVFYIRDMNNPYREVTEAPKNSPIWRRSRKSNRYWKKEESRFSSTCTGWVHTGQITIRMNRFFQQALISTIRKRIASSFTTTASSNLTRRSLIFINTLKKRIAWSTQF